MSKEEHEVALLVNTDPFQLCGVLHHAKRDRHEASAPCPVALRVKESWEIIRVRLALAKTRKEEEEEEGK